MIDDEDVDDYEYQQSSAELSGKNVGNGLEDTYDYGFDDYPYYDHNLDKESPVEYGYPSPSDSEKDKSTKKHVSHSFLPVLIQIKKNTIDPILKEKYSKAIAKFKENRCNCWEYDENPNAFYDDSSGDWIDIYGQHHPDEDFLCVDIIFYKELDPRLLIICYQYFIRTYSFAVWYKQLSAAQIKYLKENLHDFDISEIQTRIVADDFSAPPSNDNINEILIEHSPDLSTVRYREDYDDKESYVADTEYPFAGIVFKKFEKKDFDKLNLYTIPDEVYSLLVQNYKEKLSDKKMEEVIIRDYAKIILELGTRKDRKTFFIQEQNEREIKAVEFFVKNKEIMLVALEHLMGLESNYYKDEDSLYLQTLSDDLEEWYDFYLYYKDNIEGRWRLGIFGGYHKWGLLQAFSATGGKKIKGRIKDNVLYLDNDKK